MKDEIPIAIGRKNERFNLVNRSQVLGTRVEERMKEERNEIPFYEFFQKALESPDSS